jgi:hypothetical protein
LCPPFKVRRGDPVCSGVFALLDEVERIIFLGCAIAIQPVGSVVLERSVPLEIGVSVGEFLFLLCLQCAGAVGHEVPVGLGLVVAVAAVLGVASTRQAAPC